MKTWLFLSVFAFFQIGTDVQFKPFHVLNPEVIQGGTLIIEVAPQFPGPGTGIFLLGKNYKPNNSGRIFVGIPADMEPGRYQIFFGEYNIIRNDVPPEEFEVSVNKFPEWFRGRLPVLSRPVIERLMRDREIKERAYNSALVFEDYTAGRYINPLDLMEITGEFGTRRIYGKRDRKTGEIKIERIDHHNGVDLRARTPKNVRAINSGRILLAGNLLADGKIIIIDHGSGVLSLYLHLSRLSVRENDFVLKGQIIARTGSTGAAQSPHLHFMIRINGTYVDPLMFISTTNLYTN